MVATNELLCLKNAGAQISMFSTLNEKSAPMAIKKKIKILGAVLDLSAKQHCQFSPFGPFLGKWAGLALLSSW